MLRFFFWLFLIVNAALFAFNLGYSGNPSMETHEPQRASQQQKPNQLALIPADVALAAEEVAKKKKQTVVSCLEIGNFQTNDAPAVEEKLGALNLGERQMRIGVTDTPAFIVYIPSMGSKEGAEKKSGELQRLGIKDFFIIQEASNLNWGVSLGVFKTEEAAKQQLAALNQKGVKTARVGPRTLGQNKFAYQLHVLTGDEKELLDTISKDLPPHEERDCQAKPLAK